MKENPKDSSQTEASQNDGFQEGIAYRATTEEGLALHIDGYDGPLHILLALARTQKVDLKQISILKLAEQYLDFIRETHDLKIELAADYLVMASWLAYLKSRLILPPPHDDEVIDTEELAARLVFRLKCLEAMREASAQLMGRDLLGATSSYMACLRVFVLSDKAHMTPAFMRFWGLTQRSVYVIIMKAGRRQKWMF